MKVNFIGQGLTENGTSTGQVLVESFSDIAFDTFQCFVAFVSVSGIDNILEPLENSRKHISTFTVIVGVDQKSTSEAALRKLLSLNVNAKVYFTLSNVIFHPKLYVFKGKERCRIIVGSANFTKTGFFHNVEASIVIEFETKDADGQVLINQIDNYFHGLIVGESSNIQNLTNDLIEILSQASIVPSDDDDNKSWKKVSSSHEKDNQIIEKLKAFFPPIPIQRLPSHLKGAPISQTKIIQSVPSITPTSRRQLIWSKKLSNSDALQVTRKGTNPTGGVRLVQSDYDIDQTKFFRYDVFGGFVWNQVKATPYVEVAKVLFDVSIFNNNLGQFRLDLRYKPSGEAHQHNYTTSISWGTQLSTIIRQQNLSGKTMKLFEPPGGMKEPFLIEIS